jgi:hypothetical protein
MTQLLDGAVGVDIERSELWGLSDDEFMRRCQTDRFTAIVLANRFRYVVKDRCGHL